MKRIEKECPECRKTFYCPIAGSWVYKKSFFDSNLKYFCSHTCLTKYTARMDAEKRRRKAERAKRMMEKKVANG